MRINGKNRKGPPDNTCLPRKPTTGKTKAEVRLQRRIEHHNTIMRRGLQKGMGPETRGYRRPGSLQFS